MSTPGQSAGPSTGRTSPARTSVASDAARVRSVQQTAAIYAAQVALLYANAHTSALANVLTAGILVVVLWDDALRQALLWWFSSVMLAQGTRLQPVYLHKTA